MQGYDFKIEHVQGKNNVVVDALSRNFGGREETQTSSTEHRVSCILKSGGYTAKTLARVVENYWWPRMESSVRAYVLLCIHC